ncbi:serine hydrolase domain-containing protein [Granulosicoccus antarcticus]|uniref:Esterase EstB n=1 Tax=Granulosicoccus antarcticus IMCC3135 TaxID=1192854 RepID=A0A2Z2NZD9_9GAMM|nr:serine hydrolase domain-containing protein [Granulosicoccus antarcticus]ASJ76639.1 Esterase EstB [Granulosicoccus antarcticus IMCC3135]
MTLPASSPEQLGLDPVRLQRLEQWLEQQVEQNRVAGASVLVGRHGYTALFKSAGLARAASEHGSAQPFDRDTLVRLYSMTKPVTTVAAMMLYEQGYFQLDDPVAWYLPAFADTPVWDGSMPSSEAGADAILQHVEPQQTPMTVRQLMTHTAGLSYSFMQATPVDSYYREHDLTFPGSTTSLADLVERLAKAPLLCQPGSQWNYSVSTDVLGRLVEVWSGQSLDEYFREHIFAPLQMHNTGFHVEPEHHERFADMMGPAAGGDLGDVSAAGENLTPEQDSAKLSTARAAARGFSHAAPRLLDPAMDSSFLQAPSLFSGGGGLTGSIDDFARFTQMLLNGGELDSKRLLSSKTVEFMRQNQLPGNVDMAAMGQAVWSETSYQGIGFGLGFAVVLDPVDAQMITSAGEYHWGGAASTFFWIDPVEDLFVIFLTQLYPSSTYPMRRELRTMLYQALSD